PAPAVLGRNPDAIDGHTPVKLPSPGREVSRTHALVDVDDAGRLIVTDHGSSNGTYVDGQALSPHTPTIIAASARLQLGDTTVQLQSRTGREQPSTQG
ncbi:FHA domain-containing protein, partial [Microbacterium sp. JAI119]|uniref:FHA domain-containing protein n=4 Tax=Microbacteriaceae TaxID=85023 RepID=UPI0015C82249